MLILDTDTLSLIHSGNERVAERKDRVDPTEIATTIVTRVEILRARYEFLLKAADGEQLLRAQHWLRRSEELLSEISIVPFDEQAATQFDQLRKKKKLKPGDTSSPRHILNSSWPATTKLPAIPTYHVAAASVPPRASGEPVIQARLKPSSKNCRKAIQAELPKSKK